MATSMQQATQSFLEVAGVDKYVTMHVKTGVVGYCLDSSTPAASIPVIPIDGTVTLRTSATEKCYIRGNGTVAVISTDAD